VLAYSFVVFGDKGSGDEIFTELIQKLKQEKGLSFAVNLGDFVANGNPNQFLTYRQQIASLKVPVYNVLGNHDGAKGSWKLFEKYFGPLYYSFDYNNSHFIILNNAFKESFDREQFEWLKADLAKTKAQYKFVFMHKPVFDPSEIYKDYIMSGRAVTEELGKLFTKHQVDYVFAGHIHAYAKSKRAGVTYIVSGGVGSPLHLPPEFGGFYHYILIDVENGKIRDKAIRIYD
jgi:3',5'-cyclic AMP phosphodiesterase CpdA